MKNIKKIIFIALLAISAVACTNEDDFVESKDNKMTNKSDINELNYSPISPFPEYEQIDITGEQAKVLLVNFNKAMNNQMSMPNMEIKQALLAMEMYFNYAIVDKNKNYDITASYKEKTFEFTVNVNDSIISGGELKTKYRQFLIGIKNEMSNKYMKFSDIFVSSKTGSTITFKIIIPPYLEGMDTHNAAMITIPSCPIVREVGDIPSVPEDVVIDWGIYFENWTYNPSTGNLGFPYFFGNPQNILESYCVKPLEGFVYGITGNTLVEYYRYNSAYHYFQSDNYYEHPYFDYSHVFNNQEIMDYLIPPTLVRADELRQTITEGKLLLDIEIVLNFPYLLDERYTIDAGCLQIEEYKSGYVVPWIEFELDTDNIVFVG